MMPTNTQSFKPGFWLFLLCCLLRHFDGNAQGEMSSYLFQSTQGSYSEITGGTVLGNADIDEQVFMNDPAGQGGLLSGPGFPIGFSFTFGGEVFTRFGVATNGFIRLGNGTFSIQGSVNGAFSQTPFPLADTANFSYILAPLHGDLEGQDSDPIRFQTIGTAPNRELVVQWKNVRFWNTIGTENLNFQIRLQEGTNRVSFVYGAITKNSDNRDASVGLRALAYNDVAMRRARVDSNETWATSSGSASRGTRCDIRTAFRPSSGLTFHFVPLPGIEQDMAVRALVLSENLQFGCAGSTAEALRLRIQNRGSQSISGFSYGLRLNGTSAGSGDITLTPPLASNEIREIPLPATVNMTTAGEYRLEAWSSIPTDTGSYQLNDTTRLVFRAFAPMAVPAPGIPTFAAFAQRGWKSYTGKTRPSRPSTRFFASNTFSGGTAALSVPGFGTDSLNEWWVSPSFSVVPGTRLKFRMAVTFFDTLTAVTNIGDDQILVRYTSDCGQTWSTLATYNQAQVTAGTLSNKRNGYSIPLDNLTGNIQVAFFFSNQSTAAPSAYNFHLDDVTLSLGNAFDLAAVKVEIQNQVNPTCSLTQFPVRVRIRNTGDSVLTSSPVSVQVNSLAPVVQNFTFSPPLAKGDSTTVEFPAITLPTNSPIRLIARTRLATEDGFSVANDTVSLFFVYIGSANPLALPVGLTFDNLPTGIPAGWLVDQGAGSDFRVRVRGTNSTRSVSALMFANNRSSFAIMPTTQVLPSGYQLVFNLRIRNDLGTPFSMGPQDSLVVRVTADYGSTYTRVLQVTNSAPIGYDSYGLASADLAAFAGQSVAVRFDVFLNRSDLQGAWVDLDNISLSPTTSIQTSISGEATPFLVPNPARDFVEVKGISQELPFQIIGTDGKTCLSGKVKNGQRIGIEALPQGVFTIQLTDLDQIHRIRFVKP